MRELRSDFRAVYHCAYDDVPTDEAIDLIQTLPDGSRYLSTLDPRHAWTLGEKRLADIQDSIQAFIQMESDKRTTEGAPKVARPWDEYVKKMTRTAQKIKAVSIRNRLEKTKWVDVEVDNGEHRQS